MNQADYQSLFTAIDTGNTAHDVVWYRVRDIIDLLRTFEKTHHAALKDITEGWNHHERLSSTIFNKSGYLDEITFDGAAQTIRARLEDTFRGESDYFYLTIPYAWLWASDAELNAIFAAELARIQADTTEAKRKQEEKAIAERRAQFEALKEEFAPDAK